MADARTTITEVVTGLATLGGDGPESALRTLTSPVDNVPPSVWARLRDWWDAGEHHDAYLAAWANGSALLRARDGLRGRAPVVVEWKGPHRAPGDEVVPADLRIDHVYQVSCKYLSRIVVNASPSHVFERLLAGGHGQRSQDWFAQVAPLELATLYDATRRAVDLTLPETVDQLAATDRRRLSAALRGAWPVSARPAYDALVERVAELSAKAWSDAAAEQPERMLWRLLRIGSAPYFVLGTAPAGFLRLRIGTPWDFRRHFDCRQFAVAPRRGGQPMVEWRAVVRERSSRRDREVHGHVEIRWSHGRFCGPPEAKVYLDTPHDDVPGYFPLV